MKSFLLKVIIFILITGSFTAGLIVLSDFAVRNRESQLLRISDDINLVFAGDSYVECAVNDRLIDHSINIAQSGEAYLYSYAKIKALLEHNSQIQTVYAGFSFGDMLMEKEKSWVFGSEFVTEKIQYYNYLLDKSDKSLILRNNPIAYLSGLTKSVNNNFQAFVKSYSSENSRRIIKNFGGYKHLVRDKLNLDPELNLYKEQPVEKSLVQEKYLQMISEVCRQHSVELVLFSTPKYKSYNANIDVNIRQIWLEVRNSLPLDSLADFSAITLPDSCYGDLTHLNYKGAEVFSRYLNEKLNNKGLNTSAQIVSEKLYIHTIGTAAE
jgi:hypothetical protein